MAYTREQIIALVQDYARRYGIDPAVAVAQIRRESSFNPNANGKAGEKGLAQFMAGTWERFGSGPHSNAYIPEYALDAWGKYMTHLLNLFNWDYSQALTGYNGGEGHLLDPRKHGPPSAAAQRYAREILAAAGSGAGHLPQGTQDEGKTNWLLIGAVAAIALIALGVLDD